MAASGGVGGIEWLDIETMLDEGISQGIVDSNRVGIGGYSQGGFLAAVGCTRPNNKFKAGVIGAGISDWGILAATSDLPDLEVRYKLVGVMSFKLKKIYRLHLVVVPHGGMVSPLLEGKPAQRCQKM